MNLFPVLVLGTRRLVAQIPRTAAQIPGPAIQIPLSVGPIDANLKFSTVTFAEASSYISTSVSELPEYIARNRNVSAVSAKSENKGIYDENGKIITGHIPHWHSLSEEEKSLVKAESKKLRGMKGKGQKGKSAATANQVKQLKSQNAKYKRKIKAMKRNKEVDDDNEDADANESEAENDAGDQFGGKSAKKKQKKKRD